MWNNRTLRLSLAATLGLVPAAALLAGEEGHVHPVGEKLGKVDFPVSCSAPAREEFQRAVALLHSFAYAEAEKSFRGVTAKDPACAMGWWGVAMSLFHPVWAAGNPAAAPTPAELTRGEEAVEKAKAAGAGTDRERDYVFAVAAYYKDANQVSHATRALAFEKAMEQVYRRNAEDREAAIFYALALLGTAPSSDKTYAEQKKAADILNKVLPEAPEHPGVAHYLIHSFDYPPLAPLALPAARAYSKIAPSAPHALHMPSHIFTRLALWDESIQSNIASAQAAKLWIAKTHPGAASFDQLHALDYLEYAYLQTARDQTAREVLEEMAGVERIDVPNFAAAYALAAVPARYALERRRFAEAAALTVRPDTFPWQAFPYAEALTHFARAIGGARGGNIASARSGLDRLAAIHDALVAARDEYWAGQTEIQRLAAAAWIARAEGGNDEAVRLMRTAAETEDRTDKHAVTPGSILPARELLGDLLLEVGEPAKAVTEYEASLATAPGRFNSLYGAGRAAEQAGDREKARAFYGKLLSLAAQAEGRAAELAVARGFLARSERS